MKEISFEKRPAFKLLISSVLMVLVIIMFLLFIRENSRRIIEQNKGYVEDATMQTAQRVSDLLVEAQNSINTIAILYGQAMTSPEVDCEKLKEFAENTLFDYIEFVDANGIHTSTGGRRTDVSDREYFREGMQGNSGMDVIFDARISDENLVVFYAPLEYKGTVIGVLTGHYREEQMAEMLEATFFGEAVRAFLCQKDGLVIASSAWGTQRENIFDYFTGNGLISEETMEEMQRSFSMEEPYCMAYAGQEGTGLAYSVALPQKDWMILQTFPSQITRKMTWHANMAGIVLVAELILAFLVYIAVLLVLHMRQKKKLVEENTEMTCVISGVKQVFDRFILVDFEKDTYKYIGGTVPDEESFALQGEYPELVENMLTTLCGEEDKERTRRVLRKQYIQSHLKTNMSLRYEYQIDGTAMRWVNLNIVNIGPGDALPVQLLFMRQDVTGAKREEVRMHTALKEALQAAESANYAKSDFLSRMSHDIRTPMNAIMGMTSIAEMHMDDRERVKDCLSKIDVSSRHLLGLINEVLDMSKIESGKVSLAEEEFTIAETVENLLTIMMPQIKAKQQQFQVNIEDMSHEKVVGDSQRLEQVLVNILSNAVKYTQEEGTISLVIREKESMFAGSGCYEFVFTDNGIGMEESFLQKIFEPFSRAKDSRLGNVEGTGLGMPIARNIVQMMDGDIQVESRLGEGSRFTVTVYMKICQDDEEFPEEFSRLSVLVVDDDQNVCETACEMLDSIGIVSQWVLSGHEAVEKVAGAYREGSCYSAVILDWKMPGMSGVDTAREIREKVDTEIPIIILSAYDWSPIEREARAAGVNAFIAKPLFKSRLIFTLKSLLISGEKETVSKHELLMSCNGAGKRALLVEDNEINMEIAEELLQTIGFDVDCVWDGRQAVERLLTSPEAYYDLIFMDIQMPNMNGYEAARAIRSSGRKDLEKIPIIAMTADAFREDVRKAKAAGMTAHIAKPIEIGKLTKILERLQ